MATNPNRPVYQDTIESTWGQSVADHVIRRYATPAERDADLAALTPADLHSQVVAIGAAGAMPYLQVHDGAGWRSLSKLDGGGGVITKQGVNWFTTNGAGWGLITFEEPFPHNWLGGIVSNPVDQGGGSFWLPGMNSSQSSKNTLAFFPTDPKTGGGRATTAFWVSWIAWGN